MITNRAAAIIERGKTRKVMGEFKAGTLRSGSAQGPKVTDRKQAIAIALNEGKRAVNVPSANDKVMRMHARLAGM